MEVYGSTMDEWTKSYPDFNREAWCVACEQRNY
ncbi:MAG: hypothetical protein H0V44_18660 [Planctomycetes bacterium]|nr:hypothetical protein [Planctomycetota bacterium]